MDPTKDCVVRLNTPIRGQEKNSLIIFQLSEKNGHQAIVSTVVSRTLLHECVRFIQEKHGFKVFGDLKYCLKLSLKRIRISVVDDKFTCGYLGELGRLQSAPRRVPTE